MTSIKLAVNGTKVKARVDGPLTSGTRGLPVTITYDRGWDSLTKTLVCRSSAANGRCDEVRTILSVGTEATVAHEVMIPGRILYLGIEGRSADGKQVFPTVWAECGQIESGANGAADPSAEATPEVWEQIMAQMGSLDALDTDHKESLVKAINEAMTKGDGDPGKDGRGIAAVLGNEDGSWTFTYTDGAQETVNNEAYQAIVERVGQLSSEIAGKMQMEPEFADNLKACTDTTKLYVLPDGYIYAYFFGENSGPAYTNLIPLSINADGTPFNGGQGWKAGYRLNSKGEEVASSTQEVTGFIPVNHGDTVYLKNVEFINNDSGESKYLALYDSNFNLIRARAQYDVHNPIGTVVDENNILTQFVINAYLFGNVDDIIGNTAYLRINCNNISDTSIITVNEEITDDTGAGATTGWQNTGHAFVPADYESRIIALEKSLTRGEVAVYGAVDESGNIILCGPMEAGTYTFKYMQATGEAVVVGTLEVT